MNGFAQYVFHVNSSVLFRDIMFTVRPIVVWAKSNRTTPINNENMFISGEYQSDLNWVDDEIQMMNMFSLLMGVVRFDLAHTTIGRTVNMISRNSTLELT